MTKRVHIEKYPDLPIILVSPDKKEGDFFVILRPGLVVGRFKTRRQALGTVLNIFRGDIDRYYVVQASSEELALELFGLAQPIKTGAYNE